jgi:formylmethanofuran dehydrogenase subunit E
MSTSSCPHCGQAIQLMKGVAVPTPKPVAAPVFAPKPKDELSLVRCNRCGEENLCWQTGKSGKFYLCKTRTEGGSVIPLRKEFHVCNA